MMSQNSALMKIWSSDRKQFTVAETVVQFKFRNCFADDCRTASSVELFSISHSVREETG